MCNPTIILFVWKLKSIMGCKLQWFKTQVFHFGIFSDGRCQPHLVTKSVSSLIKHYILLVVLLVELKFWCHSLGKLSKNYFDKLKFSGPSGRWPIFLTPWPILQPCLPEVNVVAVLRVQRKSQRFLKQCHYKRRSLLDLKPRKILMSEVTTIVLGPWIQIFLVCKVLDF